MNTLSQKVPFREKVGYSLGDSSANFVFQIMIIFQLGFYTDVFGISAAAAGTLLLVARFWDAFFDPIMGIVADRTNTRWGKFRPWILWSAIPFGVIFFLAFQTPDFGSTGKLIYAYVTYLLLMTIYSVNNTPYSALHGVMTSDIKERTSISSVRFFFAMGAAFLVQGLTLPLVTKFGGGNDKSPHGWAMAIGVFAILAIIFFVITFFSAKERITPPVNQKSSIKQDFRDLAKTRPWFSMFILTLFIFITLALWGSGIYYYFNYFVDKASTYNFLQLFGLVNSAGFHGWTYQFLNAFGLIVNPNHSNVITVGLSFFNMSGQLVTILGVLLLSKPLADRFGKRNVFIVCLSLTTLFTALFIIAPAKNIGLVFTLNLFKSLSYAPTIPLLWAMMGDVADYFEWKTARRATGFVFAGIVFALKAGLGLGGAICGWILGAFGYASGVAPDTNVLLGIRLSSSIFPAITFFIGVIALFTYTISKKSNEEMQLELAERRKSSQ